MRNSSIMKNKKNILKNLPQKNVELEFLPEHLEILKRPPATVARFFVFSIIFLVLLTLTWSILGKIEVIASAEGKLILSQGSKTIQAPSLAEVKAINVKDGEKVIKNQVLIELNPTISAVEKKRLQDQILAKKLEISRVKALLTDSPLDNYYPPSGLSEEQRTREKEFLISEYKSYDSQIRTLDTQIVESQRRQEASFQVVHDTNQLIANAKERLDGRTKLFQNGFLPKNDYLQLKREEIELKRDASETLASIAGLRAEENVLIRRKDELIQDNKKLLLERLVTEQNQLSDLQQQLVQANEEARKMHVRSPVNGIVQELSLRTQGAVVQAAQNLLVIVPENDHLLAEMMILNKDVAFIKVGQKLKIKVESFPYTKYGTINGEVSFVSKDSVEIDNLGLVYLAKAQLELSSNKLKITPGMRITAEIKTGERRIISYLLSPLKEYQSESLNER